MREAVKESGDSSVMKGLFKPEDLRSNPHIPHETLAQAEKAGGPLGLMAEQPSPVSRLWVPLRDPVSKYKIENEYTGLRLSRGSTGVYTQHREREDRI